MVIDCHTHILDVGFWPDRWFDYAALQWAAREPGRHADQIRERVEQGLIDPDGSQMLEAMDAAGVDMAAILPMDWGPGFADRLPIRQVNEHAIELARRHAGRFLPFVGIDPRRPEAVELVESLMRADLVKGLKLYPPAGFYPYDAKALALCAICESYDVPVLFHTGETLPLLSPRFANPIFLQEVHAQFPRLKTIIGHAGAKLWWPEALSVVANSLNSYLEISVWLWADNTIEQQHLLIRRLAEARSVVGIDRIVFGSDHLSGRRVRGRSFLPTVVGWLRQLPEQAKTLGIEFTRQEVDQILGYNAAELFKIAVDSNRVVES
jgi:predicted TIM-barrel fold metal-dependent hydrolase